MALGDGTAWDETNPTNLTFLSDGDDHIRDVRAGTRIRAEKEHATFAGSSAGGEHKFMTLQAQGAKPTLAGVQIAAIYAKDVAGRKELFYEDSTGAEVQLTTGGAINVAATPAVPTGAWFPWGGALASPPSGYLTCDGSAVSRAVYAALFAAIGTTWGSGDGSTTFNLPNGTNRVLYGASEGASAGNASVGSAKDRTMTGNDNSVTLPISTFASFTGGGGGFAPTVGQDMFGPYIATGFIIKT